jgi:hypothetical protein
MNTWTTVLHYMTSGDSIESRTFRMLELLCCVTLILVTETGLLYSMLPQYSNLPGFEFSRHQKTKNRNFVLYLNSLTGLKIVVFSALFISL